MAWSLTCGFLAMCMDHYNFWSATVSKYANLGFEAKV